MGVKGLWRLLLPIGRRISIETLEGKVLAIDASIWLTQFLKAMRDPDTGQVQAAAHLLGFFRRLCRLRYHGIKPVLVFDGATPEIKKRETALRRRRREQFASLGDASVQKLARRLLAETIKKQKQRNQQQKQVADGITTGTAFAAGFNLPGQESNVDVPSESSTNTGAIPDNCEATSTVNETNGSKNNHKPASYKGSGFKRKRSWNFGEKFNTDIERSNDDADVLFSEQEEIEYSNDTNLNGSTNDFSGEVNDWDDPAPNSTSFDESPQNKSSEWVTNNSNNNKNYATLSFGDRNNANDFDIDFMAHLPADQRKDAMETAQRQQRLRSRREFMPVAAHPQQFSQVQLVNFLRSSKLKKDMVQVAKQISKNENSTNNNNEDDGDEGGFMVSDRTTRLILEREDKDKDSDRVKNNKSNDTGNKRIRWGPTHKFTHNDSSDEEVEWDDKNDVVVTGSNKERVNNKRDAVRAIVDSDDDSSTYNVEDSPMQQDNVNATTHNDNNFSKENSDPIVPIVDEMIDVDQAGNGDDNDDDETDGGFFQSAISDNDLEVARNILRRGRRHKTDHKSSDRNVNRIDGPYGLATKDVITLDDDSDESDAEEAGGFIAKQKSDKYDEVVNKPSMFLTRTKVTDLRNKQNNIDHGNTIDLTEQSNESDFTDSGGFLRTLPSADEVFAKIESDEKIAQELEDAALAQALQGMEDMNESAHSPNDKSIVLDNSDYQRAAKKQAENFETIDLMTNSDKNVYAVESDHNDDVDWEDGDNDDDIDWESDEEEKVEQAPISSSKTQQTVPISSTGAFDTIDSGNGNVDNDGTKVLARDTHDSLPLQERSLTTLRPLDNGDVTVQDTVSMPKSNTNKVQDTSSRDISSHDQAGKDIDDGSIASAGSNEDSVSIKSSNEDQSLDKVLEDDDFDNDIVRNDSDETAAALERAEAAACNLAQWAGRAFRRAMKEVGVPERHSMSQIESTFSNESEKSNADITGVKQNTDHKTSLADDLKDKHVVTNVRNKTGIRNYDDRHDSDVILDTARVEDTDANDAHVDNLILNDTSTAKINNADTSNNNVARTSVDSFYINDFDDLQNEKRDAILQEYDMQGSQERNQRERDMDTVTDTMKEEAMHLLQLFGVPYIEAPTEAEAQCAELEMLGLVDGIVTEDSDVFVFGGKTVYKNIFDEKMYTEVYLASDAEREMGLGRNAMVAMAMLLGSDYTSGVKGVGIVNAMEILQAFDVNSDLKGGLQRFRKWLDGFDPDELGLKPNVDDSILHEERVFHNKHRTARSRWLPPENFPADNVIQAFINPVVDKSTERFSWGVPDVEGLVAFCNQNIGWRGEETRRLLDPVMHKVRSTGMRQTRLDSFMTYQDSIKFADIRSSRLRNVLGLAVHERAPTDKSASQSREGKESNRQLSN